LEEGKKSLKTNLDNLNQKCFVFKEFSFNLFDLNMLFNGWGITIAETININVWMQTIANIWTDEENHKH
jgi:hypothetical protein